MAYSYLALICVCVSLGIFKLYLFMAVLSLHRCPWAFSTCGKWGLLFGCKQGAMHAVQCIATASPVGVLGLHQCDMWAQQLQHAGSRGWAQYLWRTGSVPPQQAESSRTRDQSSVPCIARRILNRWTTRKAPYDFFFLKNPNNRTRIIVYFGFPSQLFLA